MVIRSRVVFGLVGAVCLASSVLPAQAETLMEALALAYSNNPQLNIARANLRASDEGVGIAAGAGRAKINGSGTIGRSYSGYAYPESQASATKTFYNTPSSFGITLVQPLYAGGQIEAGRNQADAAVRAQREALRAAEGTVLLSAATAYMDVQRDTALVSLQESNVKFLTEQVRAAKDRFGVGEGTQTDVAQAEASYQLAVSQLHAARAQLNASRANYRQAIGRDPGKLGGGGGVDKLVPKSMEQAVVAAQAENPQILAGIHNVDVATHNVKYVEGALLPQLNAQAGANRAFDNPQYKAANSASIGLNLTVPIYQGGGEYAKVRQAKEQLGAARLQVDLARDQTRASVVSAWGSLQAANASILAYTAQVEAAQLALNGVMEEQRVGQRTTLDVLNQQTTLISARSNLVNAERSRVVGSYQLVAAIGRLDIDKLGVRIATYDPAQHYDQVKDQWIGLRTPDGQ